MLGIGHAVGLLEPHISDPFLLLLGDIYLVADDFQKMFDTFESHNCGGVLATKEEQDPEAIRRNFTVIQNAEGRVTRVLEKPRHATNRLKGVGMYLFEPVVFDSIRRTPR